MTDTRPTNLDVRLDVLNTAVAQIFIAVEAHQKHLEAHAARLHALEQAPAPCPRPTLRATLARLGRQWWGRVTQKEDAP